MPATIKAGSMGADVSSWQELLSSVGFPTPVTGIFDPTTVASTKAWQAAKGLTVDGIVGPASWSAMTGVAQPSVAPDSKAQFGRTILLKVWPQVLALAAQSQHPEVRELGKSGPNLAELQMAGAMAKIESGYGQAPYTNKLTGETRVLHNWGAVQAGPPPCGPGKFEATDTHQDGTPYQRCFREEPNDEAGALEMVKHMTIRRPTGWAFMKTGDIDPWTEAMHNRVLPNGKPKVDPITGIGGYFAHAPESRAKVQAKSVEAIAIALNEPIAAKRGGPPVVGPDLGTTIPEPEQPGGSFDTGGTTVAKRGLILGGVATAAYLFWKYVLRGGR